MFSFRTTPLLEQPDTLLSGGRVALLCNQAAWHPENGEYLFETLYRRGVLKRVFVPEDGLFGEFRDIGEFRDRENIDNATIYQDMYMDGCEFVPLRVANKDSFSFSLDIGKLTDIDALIVELQEVGSRYCSSGIAIHNIFKTLKNNSVNLPVYIVDRINPAGRQVEGSMLRKEYESPFGVEGVAHRHGLTIGEIAYLFYNEINAKFPLHIIAYGAESISKQMLPWSISPSQNIPGLFTCHFYSGQYLWEGTNMSNGIGTTRPFELFGAPYIEELSAFNKKNGFKNWNDPAHPLYDPAVFIRWSKFRPAFHKYRDEICLGFQLHPVPGVQYHALAHNLKIMEFVRRNCESFSFNEVNPKTDLSTIKILLGDEILNSFVTGKIAWRDTMEHIKLEEQRWIRKAKRFLLYEEQLYRIKL